MVALRKDVKVGLTIGAIAVLVIGVYAGLSALAGEKPADANAVKLAVGPMDGSRTATGSSGTAVTGKTGSSTPDVAKITVTPTGAGVVAGAGSTANPGQPAEANPADGLTARPTGDDPWATAFNSGALQPKKTVTPTPGKPDTAADREATIRSLNGDAKAGDAKTSTANANDGSGSLVGPTSPPVLTRTGEPATPAVPAGPMKSYTVEPGDNFSTISNQFYGDANHFNAIIAANPQVNPNRLKPGTVIKIPELAKTAPKSDTGEIPAVAGTVANAAAVAAIDSTKQYVVKPGDSLHKICTTLWNDTAQSTKLYEMNKSVIGSDPTKLKPGMVLTLPTAPTQTIKK